LTALLNYKRKLDMLNTTSDQALHKSVLIRVLIHILDDVFLSKNLFFKGGTCASMIGYLDRFSVDLDFDVSSKAKIDEVRSRLEKIFKKLNLEIKDYSPNTIQYYLKYEAPENSRNTLKIDAVDVPFKNNVYEKVLLPEINRFAICQTIDTIFANKLVALVDRHERNNSIAGRDVYDIHHFLQKGFVVNNELINERRGVDTIEHVRYLINFIDQNISQTTLDQDLNALLSPNKFQALRKTLKIETMSLLKSLL
jgi:predicted nucleotidyltransferase component of viral defense system